MSACVSSMGTFLCFHEDPQHDTTDLFYVQFAQRISLGHGFVVC